jgi:hypothetical protein
MGYFTAKYSKSEKYGKVIWSEDDIKVTSDHGRYYLYKKDYRIAEIISGKETFDKKYKGSYHNWIQAIRKKDMEKIQKLKSMAQEILDDTKQIEEIWS